MVAVNLPSTVTLVANTNTPVNFQWDGSKEVSIINLTSGTVAWARGDAVAVIAADFNYPVPPVPWEGTEVPISGLADGTATVNLISSGTPQLTLFFEDDDDN